ncbi:MAG: hypothetical protein ACOCP8_04915 [archaeon]
MNLTILRRSSDKYFISDYDNGKIISLTRIYKDIGMEKSLLRQILEKKFNAKFCYVHSVSGECMFFKGMGNAKQALEWIEGRIVAERLSGNNGK